MDSNFGARPKTYKEVWKDESLEHGNTPHQSTKISCEHLHSATNINKLPDEVLEYIFKLVSPYEDFTACSRVCTRWRQVCFQACKSKLLSFHNQVTQGRLRWKNYQIEDAPDSISKRHSHCAVYHGASMSMFVFGGCTSTSSTFNDLLQFNLTSRTWSRPRAIGTYPSPKALATMIEDKEKLILFGGWTHVSPYPLHQPWKLFSELHTFDIQESRWCHLQPASGANWPPPTAGHSATLHGDSMVVFGGLQKTQEVGFFSSSNDIWVYSVTNKTWTLQPILGESKPCGRYSQSQIYLDDQHLLVMGGCAEISNSELKDIWLLDMCDEEGWRWRQMLVEGLEHRAKDIWKHPACRVSKDRVVVLGRQKVTAKKQSPSSQGSSKIGSVPSPHHMTRNVVGTVHTSSSRRNNYNNYYTSSSSEENEPTSRVEAQQLRSDRGLDGAPAANLVSEPVTEANSLARTGGASSNPPRVQPGVVAGPSRAPAAKPPKQRAIENRQRQLATLNRVEERIRKSNAAGGKSSSSLTSPPALCPNCKMALSVLDTSKAINKHTVTWLPPSPLLPGSEAPQDRMLYSLVKARAELVLFGGYKSDKSLANIRDLQSVTNSVYILHPYIENI